MKIERGRAIGPLWHWLLWWGLAVAVAGGWFTVGALKEHSAILDAAWQRTQVYADLSAEHAARTFEGIDVALLAMAGVEERKAGPTLRHWMGALSGVTRLMVADRDGIVQLSSDDSPAAVGPVSNRDCFRFNRDVVTTLAIICQPIAGPVGGDAVLTLSRRLPNVGGRFAGVTLAEVGPAAFENFYAALGLGKDGFITLQRGDGTNLVRFPQRPGAVGMRVDNSAIFPEIAQGAGSGVAETVSPVDGIRRITAFRRIERADIVVIAGVSIDEVLANWRLHTWRTGVVMGTALLGISGLLLALAMRRRTELAARAALAASEESLVRAQAVAHVGSWEIEIPGNGLWWSDETRRMFALPPDAPTSYQLFMERIHPGDRRMVDAAWTAALAGAPYDIEHRILVEGAVKWVHERAEVVFGADGQPLAGAGTVQDITERKHVEIALRESEDRYRSLVQHSPVGILHYRRDLHVAYCNDRFASIVGVPRELMVGLDLAPLAAPGALMALQRPLDGKEGAYAGPYRTAFGSAEVHVSMTSSPMIGPDGEICGGIAIIEDITDRKQAEAQLRKLSEAVDQSPVAVMITDTSGIIEYVNRQFVVTTGYFPHEVLGKNPRLLQGGDKSQAEYEALWAAIRSGRPWSGLFNNRRKDGSLYWEQAVIAPVLDDAGVITHFVGIKEDITERRQKDLDLRVMLDRVTETNAELERFAYIASHDLQEPLRTIGLFTQLLDRRYRGRLDDEADEFIGLIVGAAQRMHTLINDLLAYSRIADRDQSYATVSAARICQQALQNLQDSIRGSAARIELGPLPEILADEMQLMQLFQNLIGNAIKFQRPGVPPVVEICAREGDGGQWVFSIADNGIGIEPSAQDVFEVFRRLHTSQAYPGTGVGLAICKRIVQRHGGRIWMESTPGVGSTFFFILAPAAG